MDTKTIAWIAGMIEGEGCFYYRVRQVRSARGGWRFKKSCLITISSTDYDIIKRISNIWKGTAINTRRNGINKDYYTTVINGKFAIQWMMTIYTLMSIRRKSKILEIINQWKIA